MASLEERPIGFGRLTRKEDARFIRGQGNFVDDVQDRPCTPSRVWEAMQGRAAAPQ